MRVFRATLVLLAAFIAGTPVLAVTPGGTVITNTATATYADDNGRAYGASSNTVSATVASVGALVVTPKESGCNPATDSFTAGDTIVRTFVISNTSNITDAYTIASASASAGSVTGIAFVTASGTIPVTVGSTVSPAIAPGGTQSVQVTIATNGVAVGTQLAILLTARTTATGTSNGLQSDTGNQCALAAPRPTLASPTNPNAPVQKLVDNLSSMQTQGGASVQYSISFKNYGGVAATNAVVTDPVPSGIHPILTSVLYNGNPVGSNATLVGQTLTVAVGTVPPATPENLTFTATVDPSAAAGTTYVNTATLQASNVAPSQTSPASVFVGAANVVYDGDAGASQPIAGATVELLDPKSGALVSLTGGAPVGVAPNETNLNPYVTGSDGTYSFLLGGATLGTPAVPAVYDLLISAPNYRNRKIQVTVTPDATGTLATYTLAALDGQPLAVPGGFALTAGPVTLAQIAGVLGNVPMFAAGGITISKSVDRPVATAGDRVVFTVQVASSGVTPLLATTVVDTLPAGLIYAPGTSRVDGNAVEPTVSGNVLTYRFASLSAPHVIQYAAVISPNVADASTLTNLAGATAQPANPGATPLTASATADVRVIAGIFSERLIITGRVYADDAGTGRFDRRDRGLAGVRVFLDDGSSVATDANGRYSFPAVRPGMHVLRVDTTTLPEGVRAYADRWAFSERSPRRLVHGVFDGMTIQDVNFAMEPVR